MRHDLLAGASAPQSKIVGVVGVLAQASKDILLYRDLTLHLQACATFGAYVCMSKPIKSGTKGNVTSIPCADCTPACAFKPAPLWRYVLIAKVY